MGELGSGLAKYRNQVFLSGLRVFPALKLEHVCFCVTKRVYLPEGRETPLQYQ